MPIKTQPSWISCRIEELMRVLKFAGKLDIYRRLKSFTVAELARKCAVDPDTMERLLAGRNAPNAANLLRIMRSLDISFEPEDFEQEGPP